MLIDEINIEIKLNQLILILIPIW